LTEGSRRLLTLLSILQNCAASVAHSHHLGLPQLRRAEETAKLVAGHAPITLEVTKEAVRRIRRMLTRDEGEDLILRAYMSEDFREGMETFLNKRTPNWKGK
jgi:enoyl-CoA hydratase/carnithine racemase